MAATPAKKPEFPNAKTYKDARGNIREVGTGRLIRAAPKPAAPKKPKTFIDGQGVVRRVGTVAGGRPSIAVNPLEQKVDAAILAQTAPLNNRVGDTNAQFGADQSAIQNAGTALNSELQALQDRIAGLGAQQLGAAASAAGGTADKQAANLDYLRNILGSNMSDGGASLSGAASALAAAAQGEGAGAVANIALGQRGAQSDLASMGGASALQRQSTVEERMRARDAALRDYRDQIAAIKANRTAVKNDLINTSLDQQAARQQIKLAQAEFDRTGDQIAFDQRMAELGFEAEQDALDAEASAEAETSKGPWGNSTGQAELIQAEINKWRKANAAGTSSYSGLIQRLQRGGGGVSAADAVKIANRVLGPAGLKKLKPEYVFKTVMDAGMTKQVALNIIKNVFGQAAASLIGTGRPASTANSGTYMPNPSQSQKPADDKPSLQNTINQNDPSKFRVGMKIKVGGRTWTITKVQMGFGGKVVVTLEANGNTIKITRKS